MIFWTSAVSVLFAVGDVSGHGVAAALLMVRVVTLLRSEARRAVAPDEVLSAINRELTERERVDMFVTGLYGILDPDRREFVYARAGHNPPVLVDPRAGPSTPPTGLGQPLGLTPDPTFDLGELALSPGSLLLLYTDGVTEAMNEEGDMFGMERTEAVLKSAGKGASADRVCQMLHADLHAFRGGPDQQDDMTTVVIRTESTLV